MAPGLVASVLRSILLPPALGWIPATPDACCGPSHLGPSVRDRLRAGLRGFPPLAALPQGLWPQLVKCLLGKPKDLSSDPQHTFQSWVWWSMPAIPMLGEV